MFGVGALRVFVVHRGKVRDYSNHFTVYMYIKSSHCIPEPIFVNVSIKPESSFKKIKLLKNSCLLYFPERPLNGQRPYFLKK